mmetsp:Transcript_37315/g.87044  ORF Transcript_37315/g.87044 Transcript_37315/m.87044 type:complete len:83 (+) Transcript_37315:18-266(+)
MWLGTRRDKFRSVCDLKNGCVETIQRARVLRRRRLGGRRGNFGKDRHVRRMILEPPARGEDLREGDRPGRGEQLPKPKCGVH